MQGGGGLSCELTGLGWVGGGCNFTQPVRAGGHPEAVVGRETCCKALGLWFCRGLAGSLLGRLLGSADSSTSEVEIGEGLCPPMSQHCCPSPRVPEGLSRPHWDAEGRTTSIY